VLNLHKLLSEVNWTACNLGPEILRSGCGGKGKLAAGTFWSLLLRAVIDEATVHQEGRWNTLQARPSVFVITVTSLQPDPAPKDQGPMQVL
jgi:hypothetical protein